MVPAAVTEAVMAEEIPSIIAWADRTGWSIRYDAQSRLGIAVTDLPRCEDPTVPVAFYFDVLGYPELPPMWWCGPVPQPNLDLTDHVRQMLNDAERDAAASGSSDLESIRAALVVKDQKYYPAPSNLGGPPAGSVFHAQPVICAPWNRLAFQVHGGPHQEWGATTDWKSAGAGYTQAHTVADMLSCLRVHLAGSPNMLVAA